MADQTEAEVVSELALENTRPHVVEPGNYYVWRDPNGSLKELDLRDAPPARKKGEVLVRDVDSFHDFYAKHCDDDSEVYADVDNAKVIAVLDAHRAQDSDEEHLARWQQHRVTLALQTTLPWRTWIGMNNKPMPQRAFAEFLEDNYRDLHPEGTIQSADFLELAQSFHATTNLEFASGTRLSSSEMELTYKETTQASAGRGTQRIPIPTEFVLAIKPFEDCEAAKINARFRYRTSPDGVVFMYVLDNPDRHREDAVKEIVAQVKNRVGRPVLLGTPTPTR